MTATTVSTVFLKYVAFVLIVGAAWGGSWSILARPDGTIQRLWARYCSSLERRLYRLFIFKPGSRIAIGQMVTLVIGAALCIVASAGPLVFMAFAFLCAFMPDLWLRQQLTKRLHAIETQVDGFLLGLANALKSTPSITDALVSMQHLVPNPLRQELELAVKQMRVGSTLDQALLHMSGRVGSRQLDSALSAILIGRQVGGNLPAILDATAASMREMARLEGVVRAKTAEGKSQVWVLACFPFVLLIIFNAMSPGYFDALTESMTGYFCTVLAFGLWGAAIFAARKVLTVDV